MVGLLARAGLYPHARNAYQQIFNRRWLAHRRALQAKFRRYVREGGLVFDVGANRGEYAQDFHELGARVVAVEANPVLAELIRARYGRILVDVVSAAVGPSEGDVDLHLATYDQHSTVSNEWRSVSPAAEWRETISVPMVTLDSLIRRYGRPQFVKIDVEGFELEVLSGLSEPVQGLVFEFQRALPGRREECIARLRELGDYSFEICEGSETGEVFATLR